MMKQLIKYSVIGFVLALSVGCHTARAIEPLFPEGDTELVDDSFAESVELPEDATGRVTDIDGTQWTKGADGHYRSDTDDCVFSKPLNQFQCSK